MRGEVAQDRLRNPRNFLLHLTNEVQHDWLSAPTDVLRANSPVLRSYLKFPFKLFLRISPLNSPRNSVNSPSNYLLRAPPAISHNSDREILTVKVERSFFRLEQCECNTLAKRGRNGNVPIDIIAISSTITGNWQVPVHRMIQILIVYCPLIGLIIYKRDTRERFLSRRDEKLSARVSQAELLLWTQYLFIRDKKAKIESIFAHNHSLLRRRQHYVIVPSTIPSFLARESLHGENVTAKVVDGISVNTSIVVSPQLPFFMYIIGILRTWIYVIDTSSVAPGYVRRCYNIAAINLRIKYNRLRVTN